MSASGHVHRQKQKVVSRNNFPVSTNAHLHLHLCKCAFLETTYIIINNACREHICDENTSRKNLYEPHRINKCIWGMRVCVVCMCSACVCVRARARVGGVRVCARVCVRVRGRVCVLCVCARVCACACVCVRAIARDQDDCSKWWCQM